MLHSRTIRWIATALLGCMLQLGQADAQTPSSAANLVAEASALIDSYSGDDAVLAVAHEKLEAALALNVNNAPLYVELSRVYVKRAHIDEERYDSVGMTE